MAAASYLHLLEARAEWLTALLFIALCVGEFPARVLRLDAMLARGRAAVTTLGRKLDRENRSIATRVYRGIIACGALLIVAVVIGGLLTSYRPGVQLLVALLLIAWFGRAFATYGGWALWQRAKADTTPLELPGLHYLFPDSHATLRYSIAARAEAFAVGVVGAAFWYIIGHLPLMFAYLTLATARVAFKGNAFGWASQSAFMLMDALPRFISRLLFVLAGLFTPHTKPFAALMAKSWREFIARLFDVTLGGPSPEGELPWVGTGTAKATPTHLRRALVLQVVASVLLLLLLAGPNSYNRLITFI